MAGIAYQRIMELLGLTPTDDTRVFVRLSSFANADARTIVFAQDEAAFVEATASGAGLILASAGLATEGDSRVLAVRNPKYGFALIGVELERQAGCAGIHPRAMVDAAARLGMDCSVGAGTVIEAGAFLGDRCVIGCNVVIHGSVRLGNNCVVQSGAVLGSTGFGYVPGPDGRHLRFPQIGTLWIGDDVEIGAGTTIDRGALGETRIGRGTKIDNLCHIAHNCTLGEDCLLAAQVGLAGSCVIEDGAMLGGQVGLGERVTIGKGTILGGQGGVLPGKRIDGEGVIYWGTPAQPVREYLRNLARSRRPGK